jgi:DNA-directed RNA polymerase specialized sigma subunit
LALQHQDIARAVAANLSRRTGHAREDLEQIAKMSIILAARRYAPERGSFRPFARRYANGEVDRLLRDRGFLIKVPPAGGSCMPGVGSCRAVGFPVRWWLSGWE